MGEKKRNPRDVDFFSDFELAGFESAVIEIVDIEIFDISYEFAPLSIVRFNSIVCSTVLLYFLTILVFPSRYFCSQLAKYIYNFRFFRDVELDARGCLK